MACRRTGGKYRSPTCSTHCHAICWTPTCTPLSAVCWSRKLTERTNQLLYRPTPNNHQFSGAVGGRHLWSPLDTLDDLPLRTIQFSCHFLLDVVLHCRERAAMRSSINCLKEAFETYLPSRRRVVHQSHRRQQQLLVVRRLHPVLLRCIGEGHICSDPCTSCYCSGSEG